ncbi:helix-turn-helix domain-containing protein [Vulgatibacter sp.]|uniref:helix-turn-helix domain-containing protein n=1 Tax=Vulgatibacter sp. TaxID=1971226 RepID=UPI003566E4CE
MSKERMKFVLEWERRWDEGEGRVNMAELCRVFGISRPTGCRWVERYRRVQTRVESTVESPCAAGA